MVYFSQRCELVPSRCECCDAKISTIYATSQIEKVDPIAVLIKERNAIDAKYEKLQTLNAELLAACKEAVAEFDTGWFAQGKSILVAAISKAKSEVSDGN